MQRVPSQSGRGSAWSSTRLGCEGSAVQICPSRPISNQAVTRYSLQAGILRQGVNQCKDFLSLLLSLLRHRGPQVLVPYFQPPGPVFNRPGWRLSRNLPKTDRSKDCSFGCGLRQLECHHALPTQRICDLRSPLYGNERRNQARYQMFNKRGKNALRLCYRLRNGSPGRASAKSVGGIP